MSKLLSYFALWTYEPAFGKGGAGDRVAQPIYFLGVLLGAAALIVMNHIAKKSPITADQLMVALVASILTFPYVYTHAGLSRSRMTFAKWCIAFQYGFFWPDLLDKMHATLGG